jgi:mono/diheme cytochrome c family protein
MRRLNSVAQAFLVLLVTAGSLGGPSLSDTFDIAPMITLADGSKTQKGATQRDGKWVLPDGTITYRVKKDGGLDWYTYSGFKRFNDFGGCAGCHGLAALGSVHATELIGPLQRIDYAAFVEVVTHGHTEHRIDLGSNKSVMCHIEDLYAYLRARSQGAVGADRPDIRFRDPKPEQAKTFEKRCLEE